MSVRAKVVFMLRKRVVLGVGFRSRRYDLRFPRVSPVYVESVEDAADVAVTCQVAGVLLVTDDALPDLRRVRELLPDAVVVVIDRRFGEARGELLAAGATAAGDGWLSVADHLRSGLRRSPERRSRPFMSAAARRRLQ